MISQINLTSNFFIKNFRSTKSFKKIRTKIIGRSNLDLMIFNQIIQTHLTLYLLSVRQIHILSKNLKSTYLPKLLTVYRRQFHRLKSHDSPKNSMFLIVSQKLRRLFGLQYLTKSFSDLSQSLIFLST